jgi:hypothetical protein
VGIGSRFMLCAPGLVLGGAEGVGSCFHFLRSRTRFRRYRGRPLPFSYFARPNSFSALPTASGPVIMFSLPDTFSAVQRASGPILMYCAPGLVFNGSEGVRSRIHVLRARTRFRRYRRRRVPFSSFALQDSFLAVRRASGPVFIFCALRHIFGVFEGVGYRFDVLRNRTHFRRFRGRRVQFSCFALPDSFSAVPRASAPDFMFCAPELVFCGTDGVCSRFLVLRSRTRFQR